MTKPIKPKFNVITRRNGEIAFTDEVVGRPAWALLSLTLAGEKGCTPLQRPAPRWSDYVHRLRKQGFRIETIDEKHGGSYAGEHARYVLRDEVTPLGGNLREFLASPEGQREFPGVRFHGVNA